MKEIEQIARASYGKLLAILMKESSGDASAAEDCLASALAKALSVWGDSGVPSNPEGWLVLTAKNEMRDRYRHSQVQTQNQLVLLDVFQPSTDGHIDRRLELLFVCAHPSIAEDIRTPLMLQTVLGLSVDRIASRFLTSPSAMAKRLMRAKAKIKQAKIPFEIPDAEDMPARLEDVLNAIYAAFGSAWDELNSDLSDEAIFLARTLVDLLPQEAEPKGLLSLMLFCNSRTRARIENELYVPIDQQNSKLWDFRLISQAESCLREASLKQNPGRFQYEAAIQAAHVDRLLNGAENSEEMLSLYRALLEVAPSTGGYVSYGAALLALGQLDLAEQMVEQLAQQEVSQYQPYWALRAQLFDKKGDAKEAAEAYKIAIGLTEDPKVVHYLAVRLNSLG